MAVIKVDTRENNRTADDYGEYCILITGTVDGHGVHNFDNIDEVKSLACKLWDDGFNSCFDRLSVVKTD